MKPFWAFLLFVLLLGGDGGTAEARDEWKPPEAWKHHVHHYQRFPSNVTNVVLDQESESVYVGSINKIYRLDVSLRKQKTITTGPNKYVPTCLTPDCNDTQTLMDNVNQIIVVDNKKERVVSCGSAFQGSCETRDWKSLELQYQKRHFSDNKENVLAVAEATRDGSDGMAKALITQGLTNGEDVLYIATDSGVRGTAKPKPIAIYSLHHDARYENPLFDYTINTSETQSHLQFIHDNGRIYTYLLMFDTGNYEDGYVYFVLNNLEVPYVAGEHAKLARICKRDFAFYSYVELPLTCGGVRTSSTQTVATAAHFVKNGTHDGKLYIALNQVEGGDSMLCEFDMRTVDRMFKKTLLACWDKKGNDENGRQIAALVLSKKNAEGRCTSEGSGLSPRTEGQCKTIDDKGVLKTQRRSLLLPNYLNGTETFKSITSCWCSSGWLPNKIFGMEEGVVGVRRFYRPNSNSKFTSLIIDDFNQVAIIGTLEGQIIKVNMRTDTSYAVVDMGQPIIGDFIWSYGKPQSAPMFYARTAKQVMLVRTSACEMYTSCDKCFASNDVYCGWCTLLGKCTTKDKCGEDDFATSAENRVKLWLERSSGGQCISNTSPLVYKRDHEGNITMKVSYLPVLNAGEDLKCVFATGSESKATTTRLTDDVTEVNCLTSDSMVELARGQGYANVGLHLVYKSDIAVLGTSVVYYECEQYAFDHDQPCRSCLTSNWNCSWSVYQHKCSSDSDIDNSWRWLRSDQVDRCPYVLKKELQPPIPVQTPVKIQIEVVNMPKLDGANGPACKFDLYHDHHYQIQASVTNHYKKNGMNTSIVSCSGTTFYYENNTKEYISKMRFTWTKNRTVDFADNLYTFYKCNATRDDCSKCLSADAKYKCGWCGDTSGGQGRCTIGSRCDVINPNMTWIDSADRCPRHQITGFKPSSGPVGGGTVLEIFGKNMGSTCSDVTEVKVNGVICVPICEKFVTSTNILCKTGRYVGGSEDEARGKVSVTIRGTNLVQSLDDFTYLSPDIMSMTPTLGPIAGGTMITIRGVNLKIGHERELQIGYHDDRPMTYDVAQANDTLIRCKTREVDQERADLPVALVIDGNTYFMPSNFTYKPNPQVTRTSTYSKAASLSSYVAGGRDLVIEGSNFKSVEHPFIRVKLLAAAENEDGSRRSRSGEPQALNSSRRSRKNRNGRKSRKQQQRSRRSAAADDQEEMYARQFSLITRRELVADCQTPNNSVLICKTPKISKNESLISNATAEKLAFDTTVRASLTLHMDNVVLDLGQLTYAPNPVFTLEKSDLQDFLELEVKGLSEELVTEGEIEVMIGEQRCNVTSVNQESGQVLCIVPPQTDPEQLEYPLEVEIGYQRWSLGSVMYPDKDTNQGQTITILVIVVVVVIIVFCILAAVWCKKRKSYQASRNNFQNAIESLETSVRADFRKAFAELSIEMSDLTADVIDTGIPCLDYRTYVTNLFFPSLRDHTCMRAPNERTEADIEGSKALKQFHDLLFNPTFLFVFVRTLEEQRQSFTNRDKSHVASLLTVALHHDLKYFTKTVEELVKNLIERNLEKNPKLIFRRNDSIADRCLSNWLYITLYPILKKNVGNMIFMLLKAIKQQVSKGPLDAVSGKARYTLSDDRLLKEDIPHQNLTLFVKTKHDEQEAEDDDEPSIVKVLTCDSVAQVKEKVMDVIYKRLPYSQRPRADQLDLEWHHGRSGQLVLPIDNVLASEPSASRWNRLYTISDYNIMDTATLALVPKKQQHQSSSDIQDVSAAPSVHSADISARTPMLEDNSTSKIYHLVKCTDETEQNRQSSINRERHKYIPDLYLLRLLNMKGILQNYVEKVIVSIFDESSIPLPVRYLFKFLDEIGEKHDITDPDILHMWKTNSLPCRFWVTILKNPEFVFDIEKPDDTIGSSMNVITQTFIDACAVIEQRPTKDSPINKQLYAKEIPKYIKMVRDYYGKIKEMPQLQDAELVSFLDNIQQETGCEFDVNTALQELWPYVNKYYDEIMEKMDDDGPCEMLKMSNAKQLLMQTYNLMEHGSNTESS